MVWKKGEEGRDGEGRRGEGRRREMERGEMERGRRDCIQLAHLQIGSEQPGCWSLHKIVQCYYAVPTL